MKTKFIDKLIFIIIFTITNHHTYMSNTITQDNNSSTSTWIWFDDIARATLRKLINYRYSERTDFSILESSIYSAFTEMTQDAVAFLLPYLNYQLRPDIRQQKWMQRDDTWRVIWVSSPWEIAEFIINTYIQALLDKHALKIQTIQKQRATQEIVRTLIYDASNDEDARAVA